MVAKETIKLDFKPRPYQADAHKNLKRFNVLVWHRRCGKTVFCLVELLYAALKCSYRDGFFAYIAPQRNQAKTVVWDRLKYYASAIPGVKYNETELCVSLPNGSKIRLFGADNPDALRGIHLDGAIMDEVADMRPRVWYEVIRPAISDVGREGWVIFIGTPKGHNFFYKLFVEARSQPDAWFSNLLRSSETGAISPSELAQARADMPAAQFAQEFECDFGASVDDSIVSFEDVLEAKGRVPHEDSYSMSAKVLGVDVARYGNDHSVIIGRQGVWSGRPKIFTKLSVMEFADQVARSISAWEPDAVFIDTGGVGGGLFDRLQQLGYNAVGVEFGSRASDPGVYRNKRVEMWARMATWLREGGCLDEDFPEDELFAPRVDFKDAGGKMGLESKHVMRERGLPSPDVADALALTFAAPVMPRNLARANNGRSGIERRFRLR